MSIEKNESAKSVVFFAQKEEFKPLRHGARIPVARQTAVEAALQSILFHLGAWKDIRQVRTAFISRH